MDNDEAVIPQAGQDSSDIFPCEAAEPAAQSRAVDRSEPIVIGEMDGFSVIFHQASFGTVGLSTLQSRAFAGQIDDTFVFCLPGSTGACRDGWDLVLSKELDSHYRPCSLAGQIPRLRNLCA